MLHPTRLGISGGIIWGVAIFALTFVWMNFDYAPAFRDGLISIYPGYKISFLGSLIGLIWGFLDAFIGFFLLAWIYNKLGGSE